MNTTIEQTRTGEPTNSRTSDRWLHQETWAASRAGIQTAEKRLMARHFAEHDFLLEEGGNPSSDRRETAASIAVNPGTAPNTVVDESLKWIAEHAQEGPFHITWYSPGTLVAATLHEFRMRNPDLSAATHVHLFPGTVDFQVQAQVGIEALEYARRIRRRFSYMFLSGYSFDLRTGEVKFNFDREIPIQRACALLKATEKFLFLDPKKFTGEGEVGYGLGELLGTSDSVVIYTVSSRQSREVKVAFERLSNQFLTQTSSGTDFDEPKSLRLTIVGRGGTESESISRRGFWKPVPLALDHADSEKDE